MIEVCFGVKRHTSELYEGGEQNTSRSVPWYRRTTMTCFGSNPGALYVNYVNPGKILKLNACLQDETTDIKGRCMVNVVVGLLDPQELCKPYLISTQFRCVVKAEEIFTIVNDAIKTIGNTDATKVLLFVSDAAAIMLKVGKLHRLTFLNGNGGDGVFYGCMLMISLSFLQLATKWPDLLKEWTAVEYSLPNTTHFQSFQTRIRWISALVCFFAIVQYTANIIVQIITASQCKAKQQNVFEYYFSIIRFQYIFSKIEYSWIVGIFLQIIDVIAYFIWLFTDVFIIIMSRTLAVQFNDVCKRVAILATKQYSKTAEWKIIRQDFNKLCKLAKLLDALISNIILISFGHNLFAILIQLFNSLRTMRNIVVKANFFLSFGFLIVRVICVTLCGASVNDESNKPIGLLNSVSSEIYNLEIRRFIQQISFDNVALTGRSFFRVTRSLIFNIAGAIVTYELVLIQFNENLLKENLDNPATNSCQTIWWY